MLTHPVLFDVFPESTPFVDFHQHIITAERLEAAFGSGLSAIARRATAGATDKLTSFVGLLFE